MTPPDIQDDYVPIISAVIAFFGGILTSRASRRLSARSAMQERVSKLEVRLEKLELRDRLNWQYIRSLQDHIYKHNAGPLPDPPEGWVEAYTA